MRCDMCPLWPDNGNGEYNDNTCPEMDGEYGFEHKDGVWGCRHPYNWVKKRYEEYCNAIGEMWEAMGKEIRNHD